MMKSSLGASATTGNISSRSGKRVEIMTGKMKLQIVGNCPDCGAPIYGEKNCEGKKAPKVTYSCECRNKQSYELERITIISQPHPYPIYVEQPKYVPVPTYPTTPPYPAWIWGAPYTTDGSTRTATDVGDTYIMGAAGPVCTWARQ